jgi:hypothetical protein
MKADGATSGFRPIIVFRYHDHFDVAKQRVKLLRLLNPRVEIHGLCGSGKLIPSDLLDMLDSNLRLELLPELAYRNVDLALLDWYRDEGSKHDFSHVYVMEWDLLYLKPLESVVPMPQLRQSLLTGYVALSRVEWKWGWTNGKKLGPLSEWLELKRYVAEAYNYVGPYHACLGPGAVLSREFFEAYSRLELPLLCHDELRLPLIHQIFNLEVADTKLYPPKWHMPENEEWVRRFNVQRWEVSAKDVLKYARQGHAAFHPVSNLVDERLIRRVTSR